MRIPNAFLATALFLLSSLAIPSSASAAGCQFTLGFKALHALIPAIVGDCLVDEHHNATNGDGLQETTRGLLVWRKADNWTAFTDGYRTWINGPFGLQARLNSERFPWESGSGAAAAPAHGHRMTVYEVTNLSGGKITVQHTFQDSNGFQYTFTSQLGPGASQTFHVRDIPNVPSPFSGSLHLAASGPISARVVGYDQS